MFTKPNFIHVPAKCFVTYRYILWRSLRSHLRLVDIGLIHHGYDTIEGLFCLAVFHHDEFPQAPVYVGIIGGSTYGAFIPSQRVEALMRALLVEVGIQQAMIGVHYCRSGRVDYHVVALNRDKDGTVLVRKLRIFRALLRREMWRLTTELNHERRAVGLPSVGKIDPRGRVVFDEQEVTSEPAAEKPSPDIAVPATAPSLSKPGIAAPLPTPPLADEGPALPVLETSMPPGSDSGCLTDISLTDKVPPASGEQGTGAPGVRQDAPSPAASTPLRDSEWIGRTIVARTKTEPPAEKKPAPRVPETPMLPGLDRYQEGDSDAHKRRKKKREEEEEARLKAFLLLLGARTDLGQPAPKTWDSFWEPEEPARRAEDRPTAKDIIFRVFEWAVELDSSPPDLNEFVTTARRVVNDHDTVELPLHENQDREEVDR